MLGYEGVCINHYFNKYALRDLTHIKIYKIQTDLN